MRRKKTFCLFVMFMSAAFFQSCRTCLEKESPLDDSADYIMSDFIVSAEACDTKASLSSSAGSRYEIISTKSSLANEMYESFGFGIDETGDSGDVLKVGVNNEMMICSKTGTYISTNQYARNYVCSESGGSVSFWGYAPYSETGLTCIDDGKRIMELEIDDPMSQEDILAMYRETNESQVCISPVENGLVFSHILTSVRFLYNGSAGVSGVIDSLRIKNIQKIGTYSISNGVWTPGGELQSISLPLGIEFGPSDKKLNLLGEGKYLLFIPQDFSEVSSIEIDYSLIVQKTGTVRKGTLTASLESLGNWEKGICMNYTVSFKDKLQTKIESSLPDTLFWTWNEGEESVKKVCVQGVNLDVTGAVPELGGDDDSHWNITDTEYTGDGKTVELSLTPVAVNNSSIQKKAILRFSYPDVAEAGVSETVLVHKPLNTDSQIFTAMKTANWIQSNDLGSGFVAVRPERPGKIYLYLNNGGAWASTNDLGNHGGSGTNDWSADFDSLESEYGIKCSYDGSSHLLSFSVSDRSTFESHLGCLAELDCKLVSGGRILKIAIKLMPDFSVSGFEYFYVGMKKYPSITGFCGNVSMKASSASGMVRYGNDRKVFGTSEVNIQNLYAYKGGKTDIIIVSDDYFNDDGYSEDIEILDPAPEIILSDSKLYSHGDKIGINIQYNDKDGNEIPSNLFDSESYTSLLSCNLEIRNCQGKPFLGSECYTIEKDNEGYSAFVSSIPDSYDAGKEYYADIVATSSYDTTIQGEAQTTVPPFDANAVSSCIASMDDYLSLNSGNKVVVKSDKTFSYGVKSSEDLSCTISPVSSSSWENDCITAAISDKNNGYITFTLSDPNMDDEQYTHSAGKHKVEVYTVNEHSGQKIVNTAFYPYINVYVHLAVGTGVYLYDYTEDSCISAFLFGDKLPDSRKCSISDYSSENFVHPVSSEYTKDETIYKWQSLSIKATIETEPDGTLMGEDNPYLLIHFSLNESGSTETQIENAKTIINNVWNDDSGNAFFGYGGLYGTVPGMSFYDGSSKVVIENIKVSDLIDDDGKGFYYVHTLQNLNQESRGWLNVLYGLGLPHDGYSL